MSPSGRRTPLVRRSSLASSRIELVFHVDPDRGSGSAEWLMVALSSLGTVIFAAGARIEWRRVERVTA